jgi:hypothetical protein
MTADATFRPFALKRPCGNCPFRGNRTPFLDRDRAQDITYSLQPTPPSTVTRPWTTKTRTVPVRSPGIYALRRGPHHDGT